jgi:hypothetical protein
MRCSAHLLKRCNVRVRDARVGRGSEDLIALLGTPGTASEREILRQLDGETVLMMGDNPELPPMPRAPRLLDFFRLRFTDIAFRHLLQSAKLAFDQGFDETVIVACLLHDIAIAALMRTDTGTGSPAHRTLRIGRDSVGGKASSGAALFSGREHMTARLITINDVYSFEEDCEIDPEMFTDIVGRHFKQPREGLGFDGPASAYMWRTMIWPTNAL